MIIVYENNCQVQSDIFFMREESKNVDKQAWKFDINSGAREPACGQGGKEKAGLRVRECLPLIERRDKRTAWDSVIDAASSTGRLHDAREIRQEHLSERD